MGRDGFVLCNQGTTSFVVTLARLEIRFAVVLLRAVACEPVIAVENSEANWPKFVMDVDAASSDGP